MAARILLHAAMLGAAALALTTAGAGTAMAQAYPAKPIRLIIPFPPGGIDLILHLLLPQLERRLGHAVVLVNRPGGTGARSRQRQQQR